MPETDRDAGELGPDLHHLEFTLAGEGSLGRLASGQWHRFFGKAEAARLEVLRNLNLIRRNSMSNTSCRYSTTLVPAYLLSLISPENEYRTTDTNDVWHDSIIAHLREYMGNGRAIVSYTDLVMTVF
jgi:hypothetical protein